MAESLMEYGIDPDRILIESVASNFPIAKYEVAGKSNEEYLHLNKRIDTEIVSYQNEILSHNTPDINVIPEALRDRKFVLYRDIKEELYYSVQIAETDRIFKNAILREYQDIYIRKEFADAPNEYYIGLYTSYDDAQELREKLQSTNLPMQRIVAFYDGRRITKSDIRALSADYPHLLEYEKNLH